MSITRRYAHLMSPFKRGRRLAGWALGILLLAALGGAVAAYGYYALRWGCPSNAETQSPRTSQEVEEAFAQAGLELNPARIPVALPPGAAAYRHERANANLFVVVCEGRACDDQVSDLSKVEFAAEGGPPQQMRRGVAFLNVFIWATDPDRRSAQRLMKRVYPIVDDLDRIPQPSDRCYVR